MLSTPSNRQGSALKFPACRAVIVPSHRVEAESVTPNKTRNEAGLWAWTTVTVRNAIAITGMRVAVFTEVSFLLACADFTTSLEARGGIEQPIHDLTAVVLPLGDSALKRLDRESTRLHS